MLCNPPRFTFFFFNDTATTEIYTLSLHDALPIYFSATSGLESFNASAAKRWSMRGESPRNDFASTNWESRSEEHTSELQSPCNLVCRLLLEKKKKCQSTSSHVLRIHISSL